MEALSTLKVVELNRQIGIFGGKKMLGSWSLKCNG
jgi:hypothetical protein